MRKPLGGISIVVDNAAGRRAARSAPTRSPRPMPDGYTLLLHHVGMGTMPTLVRNIPFKVESDFEYLGMINDVPMTLIGKPGAAGQQLQGTRRPGSSRTRARSTWATPASARPRTCAACCSSTP
jgi:tripartite-type tricarboxylate transporter receptor subunit TctC